jgi:predicted DNA-binding ribbon-helix-helix protein
MGPRKVAQPTAKSAVPVTPEFSLTNRQNQPEKPSRRQHPRVVGVRIADSTYKEMKTIAARRGVTLAELIRERLERGSTDPASEVNAVA